VSISAHFKALLGSNSEEARTGIVKLKDMSKDTFTTFKNFVLFDRTSINWSLVLTEDLIAVAHDYSVDQLKIIY
jgi:hypothetical protein